MDDLLEGLREQVHDPSLPPDGSLLNRSWREKAISWAWTLIVVGVVVVAGKAAGIPSPWTGLLAGLAGVPLLHAIGRCGWSGLAGVEARRRLLSQQYRQSIEFERGRQQLIREKHAALRRTCAVLDGLNARAITLDDVDPADEGAFLLCSTLYEPDEEFHAVAIALADIAARNRR